MKQRLLLLIPTYSSYYLPIAKTFEHLGWQVKSFDYRRGDLKIRLVRFVPLIGGFEAASNQIDQQILNLTKNFQPDLILTVKGESLSKELLTKLKNPQTKLVNWFPDPMNYWDFVKDIAPYYDVFFHFDPWITQKLNQIPKVNAVYLPFAAQISPKTGYKQTFDISFVGTYSEHREKILSKLTDFNLAIWGDPRWSKSQLASFTKGGRVPQPKMIEIIQQSKINLNLYFAYKAVGANLRTFEVTGAGGFLLSEYVADLPNLFELEKEVVAFKNDKELVHFAKLYLDDKTKRAKVAQAGLKRAQKEHTYDERIKQMLKFLYG